MISQGTSTDILGILGIVLSTLLFLAPVPTFLDIIKRKSVLHFTIVPQLAGLLNFLVAFFFRLPVVTPGAMYLETVGFLGIIFQLSYILIFLIYANKKGRIRVLFYLIFVFLFVGILATCILTIWDTTLKRSKYCSFVSMAVNIITYSSPIVAMWRVVRTGSVKYMSLSLLLVSFLNASIWSGFGFFDDNRIIFVPYLIVSILNLIQLTVYIYYKRNPTDVQAETTEADLERACQEAEMADTDIVPEAAHTEAAKIVPEAAQTEAAEIVPEAALTEVAEIVPETAQTEVAEIVPEVDQTEPEIVPEAA